VDDQGVNVNSSQFTNLVSIVGWDTTQEVGTEVSGSLSSGNYALEYIIPQDYSFNGVYIRAKVTWGAGLVNYRPSSDDVAILVYQDIQIANLQLSLQNGTSLLISNDSTYQVYDLGNRQFSISGTLQDNWGRVLGNKYFQETWNSNPITRLGGAGAFFNLPYSFPGWTNGSWSWEYSHLLDNGTFLSTKYMINLQWEIYDDSDPSITIDSPAAITSTALSYSPIITISTTITDPGNAQGYVSLGLNSSSIRIFVNGTPNSMINTVGSTYTFDWNTTGVGDEEVSMFIIAYDNAGNFYNLSFTAVIDFVEPSATISAGSVEMDSDGNIIISGVLLDNDSSTLRNSGIDPSTIQLIIREQGGPPVLTVDENDMTVTIDSYTYAWNIFNPSTLTRIATANNWEVIVSISDNAGRTYQSSPFDVTLEDVAPVIQISQQPPGLVEEGEFSISVTYSDDDSGVNTDFLIFELVNADGDVLVDTFNTSDPEVSDITSSTAVLTLNADVIADGEYYITGAIYDNNGNLDSANTIDFAILHPTTTTTPPTNTTTPGPSGPGPLQPIDLVQFILLDIIALLSGIGIAAGYERLKARRKT
jgi:hypothetical protein